MCMCRMPASGRLFAGSGRLVTSCKAPGHQRVGTHACQYVSKAEKRDSGSRKSSSSNTAGRHRASDARDTSQVAADTTQDAVSDQKMATGARGEGGWQAWAFEMVAAEAAKPNFLALEAVLALAFLALLDGGFSGACTRVHSFSVNDAKTRSLHDHAERSFQHPCGQP
jgi:hypothetical protein